VRFIGVARLCVHRLAAWQVAAVLALTAIVVGCGCNDRRSRGKVAGTVDLVHRCLRVNFRVNGKSLTAIVDTGCAYGFAVTHRTGEELGVLLSPIPEQQTARTVTPRTIEFAGVAHEPVLWVMQKGGVDAFLRKRGAQGFVGWGFLRECVLEIEWFNGSLRLLDEIPSEVTEWESWTIPSKPATPVLIAEARLAKTERARIMLDTGSNGHLTLWHTCWDSMFGQVGTRKTIRALRDPHGFDTQPEVLADCMRIGSIPLPSIPVNRSTNPGLRRWRVDAQVGLSLLNRLHIVIDGKNGKVYVKPRAGQRLWPYDYNRFGACFLPANSDSGALLAHVAEGSPARRAGILRDDRLKSIGGRPADELLRAEGIIMMNARWYAPAGTKYRLKLERDGREFEVEAELEEIFPEAKIYDPFPRGEKQHSHEPAEVK
jgi:hypothetical protein